MKEENIGVLSAGERFGFKGFEWIVLDNNVDGGVLAIMASAWNNEEYSFDDDGCNNYAMLVPFPPVHCYNAVCGAVLYSPPVQPV